MGEVLNNQMSLQKIKNELLCYGARLTPDALLYISSINPYISNKGIHAASFYIGDKMYINMQFSEKYNSQSPYLIICKSDLLYLTKNKTQICEIHITPAPPWYEFKTSNGILMHKIFNVHGNNVLALSNYDSCCYIDKGQKCKFCSFTPSKPLYKDLNTRIEDAVETLKYAFEFNCNYSIALSEGTKIGNDRGALFLSKFSKAITSTLGTKKISAELAPPTDNIFIDDMINNGITSIIMNIELYDDQIRQFVCPGKSEIPIERYFDSLSYSVKKIGVGNVSSVLVAGIESPHNTIKCAKKLLQIGVIPTVIPFKPYDNCELRDKMATIPSITEKINDEIEKEMVRIKFPNIVPHSCLSCGACNVIKL